MRVVLYALLAGIGLAGCEREPASLESPAAQVYPARTMTVARREVPLLYTTTGSMVSDERVEISSRTAAYVRSIEVREGQRVELRQLLATLDSQDIEAGIRAAQALRDQARAARDDAARDVQDSTKLFGRGLVAEAHLRKARLQQQSAVESLAAAEAELTRAEAERQYTRILSPVAGVVVARHRRTGDLASPGAPLITVESDTRLLFETYVAEQRVAGIRTGDAVQVAIDALGKTLEGEVLRLVSSGNPVTRGFLVKVSIPASPGLLPGMFGRARFTLGTRPAVVIPAQALVERGGLTGVYVVGPDQGLRFRWLRTEHETPEDVVVVAGLDVGERIVAAPLAAMREGDRVSAAESLK